MNLTQKISQMTPKGADLDATDLIEVSTIVGGSYVTKSITGQELIDAIPLPPSGLTVGTTPIASGTIGRVLFQGTGNVLQQSSSLFWDGTNNRLGIGTSTPSSQIDVFESNPIISTRIASSGIGKFNYLNGAGTVEFAGIYLNANSGEMRMFTNTSYFPTFYSSNAERMRIPTTGNVLINTTTDAGFRLDVNGNSRVRGAGATGSTNAFTVQNSSGSSALSITNGLTTIVHGDLQLENTVLYWSSGSQIRNISNGVLRISDSTNANFTRLQFGGGTTAFPSLQRSGSALAVMDATGTSLSNLLIGTTTDSGYKLDVNGDTKTLGLLTAYGISTNLSDMAIYNTTNNTGYIRFITQTSSAQAERMRIANTGNVLIGTTTDAGFKLDVNGTARFSDKIFFGRANFSSNDTDGQLRLVANAVVYNSAGAASTSTTSSCFEITSTTKGFLPPRMTTTQKNAIASPAAGLVVYDTTLAKLCVYTTTWETITSL